MRVAFAEIHRQHNLGKLGTHAQKRADPHPEHSARTAQRDSAGNAGDIAGAYRRRKRGTYSLERRDGAFLRMLFAEHPAHGAAHGRGKLPDLNKPAVAAEPQTDAQNQDHGRNAPDKVIEFRIHQRNHFNHRLMSSHQNIILYHTIPVKDLYMQHFNISRFFFNIVPENLMDCFRFIIFRIKGRQVHP